jgi:hypothetical protein
MYKPREQNTGVQNLTLGMKKKLYFLVREDVGKALRRIYRLRKSSNLHLKKIHDSGNLHVHRRIILKWVFKELGARFGLRGSSEQNERNLTTQAISNTSTPYK